MKNNSFILKLENLIENRFLLESKFNQSEVKKLEAYISNGGSLSRSTRRGASYLDVKNDVNILSLIKTLKEDKSNYTGRTKRSSCIAKRGLSKSGLSGVDNAPIVIKAFSDILLCKKDYKENLKEKTIHMGMSSYALDSGVKLKTEKEALTFILIENLETFIDIEYILNKYSLDVDVAVFYNGNISASLLSEITQWCNDKTYLSSFLVFPDFDPVGLDNYIKIKGTLIGKAHSVKLFFPEDDLNGIINLAKLKTEYFLSKQSFSVKLNKYIRFSLENDDENLKKAISLIKLHGKTIEQESLSMADLKT